MNVDLLTNQQVLSIYTNDWCKRLGIKSSDLGCGYKMGQDGKIIQNITPHPAIDDVMILVKMRDEFWTYWNASERATWAAYWNTVYHHGHPLKKKALSKLETISNSGIYRQEQKTLKAQYIKQLRESKQKNGERI